MISPSPRWSTNYQLAPQIAALTRQKRRHPLQPRAGALAARLGCC